MQARTIIRLLVQPKARSQLSGLSGRRRDRPAMLQIDVEMNGIRNNGTSPIIDVKAANQKMMGKILKPKY